jgi:hypothetical protein
MGRVSTARKLGIAARVASEHVRRSRTWRALSQAGRATAAHTGGVLNQLWLEVTGFTFLALAAVGVLALLREYGKYHSGQVSSSRVVMALGFTVMFAWFGVSSFWRVRKKSEVETDRR